MASSTIMMMPPLMTKSLQPSKLEVRQRTNLQQVSTSGENKRSLEFRDRGRHAALEVQTDKQQQRVAPCKSARLTPPLTSQGSAGAGEGRRQAKRDL
jgi:hypothetical protein